ncbi:site-specific integrase [Cytobacillus firmus]|uniref:Site-specific integrase n=1 Tax=Cytobacillus firmus TaxID=1399 RepID=A0AA46PVT1_CYTFI|nr:site-specific integrase [Cytobacillus firmus]UYG98127.1 site-specific integrase [Cytobacillus firmus]
MTLYNYEPENEEFDFQSEEYFSLEQSLRNAHEIFDSIKEQNIVLNSEFKDDIWILNNKARKGTATLDFSSIKNSKLISLPSNLKVIIKCWITENSLRIGVKHLQTYLNKVLKALELTDFKKEKVEILIKWIDNENTTRVKVKIINALLNLFDYYDFDCAVVYTNRLLALRSKFKSVANIRPLPPSKDILLFSYYLEEFAKDVIFDPKSDLDEKIYRTKLIFYPILIWWRLTTIIPLRPGEFCAINRECLFFKDDKWYIRLPRNKIPIRNARRIQIIDEFAISEDMYELLSNYIKETNKFGRTATLISYRSIIWADPYKDTRKLFKKDPDYITHGILYQLIKKFYVEVLEKIYNCNIPKDNHVKPNSTRHIAIVSLMLQGISPIHIARLAGHATVETQFLYQDHKEYWVDSEVFNLMKKYKYLSANEGVHYQESFVNSYVPHEIQQVALKPNKTGYKSKLKIGFCTDELQRCPTDDCLNPCEYWLIGITEYLEKEEEIKKRIHEKRRTIDELFTFIHNLHRIIFSDEQETTNPNSLLLLKVKANQIQGELHSLANLMTKLPYLDTKEVFWIE